jgi:hypothetical protein
MRERERKRDEYRKRRKEGTLPASGRPRSARSWLKLERVMKVLQRGDTTEEDVFT